MWRNLGSTCFGKMLAMFGHHFVIILASRIDHFGNILHYKSCREVFLVVATCVICYQLSIKTINNITCVFLYVMGHTLEPRYSTITQLTAAIIQLMATITQFKVAIIQLMVAIIKRKVAITQLRADIIQLRTAITQLRFAIRQFRANITQRRVAIKQLKAAIIQRGLPSYNSGLPLYNSGLALYN